MALRIKAKTGAITRVCKDLEVSRDELARRMSVSTATAYRIDSRKVEPSPRFIAALITASGKSFDDLFEIVGVDEDQAVPA